MIEMAAIFVAATAILIDDKKRRDQELNEIEAKVERQLNK